MREYIKFTTVALVISLATLAALILVTNRYEQRISTIDWGQEEKPELPVYRNTGMQGGTFNPQLTERW